MIVRKAVRGAVGRLQLTGVCAFRLIPQDDRDAISINERA